MDLAVGCITYATLTIPDWLIDWLIVVAVFAEFHNHCKYHWWSVTGDSCQLMRSTTDLAFSLVDIFTLLWSSRVVRRRTVVLSIFVDNNQANLRNRFRWRLTFLLTCFAEYTSYENVADRILRRKLRGGETYEFFGSFVQTLLLMAPET